MSLDSTKDSDEETFRSGIIHTLITSVIDLKLYIELGLKTIVSDSGLSDIESDAESTSETEESTPHIVLITGYEHIDEPESVNISIKNSWGELSNTIKDYKLESVIDLDGEHFNQTTMYFLLPMIKSRPVDESFTFKESYSLNEELQPLFDFIGEYHFEYSNDLFKRKGGTRRKRKRRSKTMNRKRIA